MKIRRNLALIVAAGQGRLAGSKLPIQFSDLSGKPVLARTIECFEKSRVIDEIVLVVSEDYLAYASQAIVDKFGFKKIHKIVTGGETRQESVLAGLVACPRATDKIAIHDGVRPFVKATLIETLFDTADDSAAAVPGIHPRELAVLTGNESAGQTFSRGDIFLIQAPQVFFYSKMLDFHRRAQETKFEVNDDARLAEQYGMKLKLIPGRRDNISITDPLDIILAKEIIKQW